MAAADMVSGRRAPRLGRTLRRFVAATDGTTVIEFAILFVPFAVTIFAILETCLAFAAQAVMTNAADDVARQIRTGQIAAGALTAQSLHDKICQSLQVIVAQGCPSLQVDLRTDTFPALAQVAKTLPLSGTGADRQIDSSQLVFQPGTSSSPSMLRVFYPWPVITDLIRQETANLADGHTLLFSTVTWQNEKF